MKFSPWAEDINVFLSPFKVAGFFLGGVLGESSKH